MTTSPPGTVARADCVFPSYQRAFVDFFEDQLVQHGYDWRDLVSDFLYEGEAPLINNLVSGRKLGGPMRVTIMTLTRLQSHIP